MILVNVTQYNAYPSRAILVQNSSKSLDIQSTLRIAVSVFTPSHYAKKTRVWGFEKPRHFKYSDPLTVPPSSGITEGSHSLRHMSKEHGIEPIPARSPFHLLTEVNVA